MGRLVAAQAVDDAQVVGVLSDVGEEIGNPQAALAVLLELPGGSHERFALAAATRIAGFAVIGEETRFVVKGIDIARAALHEKENDALGAGEEMRRLGRQWADVMV